MDRRQFVAFAAAAAALRLTPAGNIPAPYGKSGPLEDWSIDDMTGAAPRYAETIGAPGSRSLWMAADPHDVLFPA